MSRGTPPFGVGLGKARRFGRRPVNAQLAPGGNVRAPGGGPSWQLRFPLSLIHI